MLQHIQDSEVKRKTSISRELRKIKKKYGEQMMHLCRKLFPSILEEEGRLLIILEETFGNHFKGLYYDIIAEGQVDNFAALIMSKIPKKESASSVISTKTPFELMEEAGYQLYECHNHEETQQFRKYYDEEEELCTFHDDARCLTHFVFFAVKKDVNYIVRENFVHPKREDDYGVSVLGIQFSKKKLCRVSIKCRYNHTVQNPDATYGNCLDKIVPGLEASFRKWLKERGYELDVSTSGDFVLTSYVVVNGKWYYSFFSLWDKVYCSDNIVIDKKTYKVEVIGSPEKKLLVEFYVFDLERKTVSTYDEGRYPIYDAFVDDLQEIEKMEVLRDKEKGQGIRMIQMQKKNSDAYIQVTIDADNRIIGYRNDELRFVGNNFMCYSWGQVRRLELPRLEEVGDNFLFGNEALESLTLPCLHKVGNNFLCDNTKLQHLEAEQLVTVGNSFLYNNVAMLSLSLPRLKSVKDDFMMTNKRLFELELPHLEKVRNGFFLLNEALISISFPMLTKVGSDFFYSNGKLNQVYLPRLCIVKDMFLCYNYNVKEVTFPRLEYVGADFMTHNKLLEHIECPKLSRVGFFFLSHAILKKAHFPMLKHIPFYSLSISNEDVLDEDDKKKVKQKADEETSANTTDETLLGYLKIFFNRLISWLRRRK